MGLALFCEFNTCTWLKVSFISQCDTSTMASLIWQLKKFYLLAPLVSLKNYHVHTWGERERETERALKTFVTAFTQSCKTSTNLGQNCSASHWPWLGSPLPNTAQSYTCMEWVPLRRNTRSTAINKKGRELFSLQVLPMADSLVGS